jgi:uncharacterized protein YjiS (DUF1127 family)
MARQAYKRTLSTLSKLDCRSLRDIGISRCDIPRLATEAATRIGSTGRAA